MKKQNVASKILAYLRRRKSPRSTKQIVEAIGEFEAAVRSSLHKLFKDRVVRRLKPAGKKTYAYFIDNSSDVGEVPSSLGFLDVGEGVLEKHHGLQ